MSKTVKDLTAGTVGGIAQVNAKTQHNITHILTLFPRCSLANRSTLSKLWVQLSLPHEAYLAINNTPKRMQTSAKGTYTGMLHCAGGILKNEGPLAFYKVRTLRPIYSIFTKILPGNFDPAAGYWPLCVHPIWSSGIYQTIFCRSKCHEGNRRRRRQNPHWVPTLHCWRSSRPG